MVGLIPLVDPLKVRVTPRREQGMEGRWVKSAIQREPLRVISVFRDMDCRNGSFIIGRFDGTMPLWRCSWEGDDTPHAKVRDRLQPEIPEVFSRSQLRDGQTESGPLRLGRVKGDEGLLDLFGL